MKKRISFLLAVLLVATMLLPMSMIASAEEPEHYFEVVDGSGTHLGYYDELQEAVYAMNDNYTLKVLKDYSFDHRNSSGSTVTDDGIYWVHWGRPGIGNRNLTNSVLDGQGHTITGYTDNYQELFKFSSNNCTVKNLKIVDGHNGCPPVRIGHGTSITFINCTFVCTQNVVINTSGTNSGATIVMTNCVLDGGGYNGILLQDKMNLTLNNCYFTRSKNSNGGARMLNPLNGATITVNGGVYIDKSGLPIFGNAPTGSVTINSGVFCYTGDALSSLSGGTLTINGGTFFPSKAEAVIDNGSAVLTDNTLNGGISLTNLNTTNKASSIAMQNGAAVRLVEGSNGIRFKTDIPKALLDYVAAIKDNGTDVTYGTVIAPKDYVEAAPVFTMEGLDAVGKTYQNIVATSDGITANEGGSVTISAALINLLPENITRDFSAVAYVKFVKGEKDVYVYTVYDSAQNARNMRSIAEAALADTTAGYTDAQKEVLRSYIEE